MTMGKRDWFWIVAMVVVCSGLDKRGWSEPIPAVIGGLIGACFGFGIARLTKRLGTQ